MAVENACKYNTTHSFTTTLSGPPGEAALPPRLINSQSRGPLSDRGRGARTNGSGGCSARCVGWEAVVHAQDGLDDS